MNLRVPGATLHYDVRGTGPMLLISQSGEGDADRSVDLVDQLVDRYTVITYDRRGLSRSVMDDPEGGVTMRDHADDVHRLLAAVTDEPVAMLGCSLGAVIGLHLSVAHPEQIHTLVAHEPVAPWLLPADEADHHRRELAELQTIHRRDGWTAAVKEVARVLGIDPASQDKEPGLTPQPMTPARGANFDFFLAHDFTAVIEDTLDLALLGGTRIIPAAGRTTPREVFDYRCAQELARIVGTDIAEFPGGHNGNLTHPRAYAARLVECLSSAGRTI
ncbi:alpha/beta fold hydrolase [Nonomuraea sediminis]|uniref:alpha/beta fold hydrolase n=1 Tax=Nonomuraea sediminis TaxID=2835864 RepID=UPI001BDC5511|nr:alpha/beta hydrolase [Nonomuraea sediminis]